MTGPAQTQAVNTYADGETPKRFDIVRVDPLDRGRIGQVVNVSLDGSGVFVEYSDDFESPLYHWCSVDRCVLVRRR